MTKRAPKNHEIRSEKKRHLLRILDHDMRVL